MGKEEHCLDKRDSRQDPRTDMGRLADCSAEYCIELMACAGQEHADQDKIAALHLEIQTIEASFSGIGKQIFVSPSSGEILIGPYRLHE